MPSVFQYGKQASDRLVTSEHRGQMRPEDKAKLDTVLYGPNGEILLHTSGAGGVGRYTRRTGPQEDVHLRTGDAAGSIAIVEAQGATYLTQNCYWDGANFQRHDTGNYCALIAMEGGELRFYRKAAGANPVGVWDYSPGLTGFKLEGLSAIGTEINSSRTSNLAIVINTNTTIDTITLTEGTWLVQGYALCQVSVAGATADVWLAGYTVPVVKYFANAAEFMTLVTYTAVAHVAEGTFPVVNLTVRMNSAGTVYWTGGAAGFGGLTGTRAVRIG